VPRIFHGVVRLRPFQPHVVAALRDPSTRHIADVLNSPSCAFMNPSIARIRAVVAIGSSPVEVVDVSPVH
jgi:hypothetical protein